METIQRAKKIKKNKDLSEKLSILKKRIEKEIKTTNLINTLKKLFIMDLFLMLKTMLI